MAKASATRLASVVGGSCAEAMLARAKIILHYTGDEKRPEDARSIIEPSFAVSPMSNAFVADPGIAPLASPHSTPPRDPVSANPTPHP